MGETPLFTPAGAVPPVMRKSKHRSVQAEGVEGATADIRLFSLPPCRLRRGEIPLQRERPAQREELFSRCWSLAPMGATICKLWEKASWGRS